MSRSSSAEIASLSLFDCNCMVGPARVPQPGAPDSAPALLVEMDRQGIAEALVYHSLARWYSAAEGNAKLLHDLKGEPRLHPCWVLLPHHAGEMPAGAGLVRQMRDSGVRAARVFPDEHFFFLEPWCFGETLAALAEARIPLIVDWNKRHWSEALRGWAAVRQVCETYPQLPVIVLREGMATARFLPALLEAAPGLALEISYYIGHESLAVFAARFGVGRLLLGTGAPFYDPALGVGLIATGGLDDNQARSIAGDNLRALLAGVKWP